MPRSKFSNHMEENLVLVRPQSYRPAVHKYRDHDMHVPPLFIKECLVLVTLLQVLEILHRLIGPQRDDIAVSIS